MLIVNIRVCSINDLIAIVMVTGKWLLMIMINKLENNIKQTFFIPSSLMVGVYGRLSNNEEKTFSLHSQSL